MKLQDEDETVSVKTLISREDHVNTSRDLGHEIGSGSTDATTRLDQTRIFWLDRGYDEDCSGSPTDSGTMFNQLEYASKDQAVIFILPNLVELVNKIPWFVGMRFV